jgi:hypothetical protein
MPSALFSVILFHLLVYLPFRLVGHPDDLEHNEHGNVTPALLSMYLSMLAGLYLHMVNTARRVTSLFRLSTRLDSLKSKSNSFLLLHHHRASGDGHFFCVHHTHSYGWVVVDSSLLFPNPTPLHDYNLRKGQSLTVYIPIPCPSPPPGIPSRVPFPFYPI